MADLSEDDLFDFDEEYNELMAEFAEKVLVVEDDPIIGKNIVKIINDIKDEEFGYIKYKAIWAKNGVEALDIIKKDRKFFKLKGREINCILLDMRMPEMDGPQFLKKLRAMEKKQTLSRYTPVVFLTAYEDDEKWASALDGMAIDYIRKPFEAEMLVEKLNTILEFGNAEFLAEETRKKGLSKRNEYNKDTEIDVTAKNKPSFKSKLIMLVEDEPAIAKNTVKMIEAIKDKKGYSKYRVIWARNGLEGFKLLKKNRQFLGFADNKIKCILLDMRMPEMDGTQFLNRLRKIESRRLCSCVIPVVFTTAYEEFGALAKNNMVSDYLRKPISAVQLEHTLKRIFDEWDADTMASLLKENYTNELANAIKMVHR